MFGMGWAEMMIVGIVALIVVGPKELPVLFRKIGNFAGKAKSMGREFSRAMNQAADQAGVNDIKNTMNSATSAYKTAANPVGTALQGVKDATSSFTKLDLDPDSETGKLAAERAEKAKKIHAATARAAAERKAKEAEEALKAAERAEEELREIEAAEQAQPLPNMDAADEADADKKDTA